MALREPAAGLRRIRHNANSPKRVELIIPGGDELAVSDDLAAQLAAADSHFQPVDEPAAPPPASPAKRAPAGKRSGRS